MKIIYFFVLIAFVSCKLQYIEEGTKKIENLKNELKIVEDKLLLVDTIEVSRKQQEYVKTISLIKKIKDDNFTKEEWEILSNYAQIRKKLKNFVQEYPSFYKELDYSKNQLENLENDLRKKIISEEKFNEYLKKETEAIDVFLKNFNFTYNGLFSIIELYDSTHPNVLILLKDRNIIE